MNSIWLFIYEVVSHTDSGRPELIFVKSKCTVEAISSKGIFVYYGAGLEKGYGTRFNKNPWMFRKMLLETPSGFIMLDAAGD